MAEGDRGRGRGRESTWQREIEDVAEGEREDVAEGDRGRGRGR